MPKDHNNPYLAHRRKGTPNSKDDRRSRHTYNVDATKTKRKGVMPLLVGREYHRQKEGIAQSHSNITLKDNADIQEFSSNGSLASHPASFISKIKPANAFGNYPHYYGYRLSNNTHTPSLAAVSRFLDPRLALFEKEWFQDLNSCVLDIGCNSGLLTMQCAFLFEPKKMEGVDIDLSLIRKAKAMVHSCASLLEPMKVTRPSHGAVIDQEESRQEWDYFPISCLKVGKRPLLLTSSITDSAPSFPGNLEFRCSDWVNEPLSISTDPAQKYSLILALSITKWIHLHGGDGGIKYFFQKCYNSLLPGGKFIIEPQDWNGYGKRANMTSEMKQVYQSIRFRPENFVEYLLSPKIGFVEAKQLNDVDKNGKGFQRPIYVLTKKGPL